MSTVREEARPRRLTLHCQRAAELTSQSAHAGHACRARHQRQLRRNLLIVSRLPIRCRYSLGSGKVKVMVTADHVLLAGTADECRSPMAVRIFRRALQAVDAAGDWDVSSAGTSAAEEQPRQFARPIGDGSSRVRVAPSSAQAAAVVDGARKTGARSEPGDDDIADLVGRRRRHVEAAAPGVEAAVVAIIETLMSGRLTRDMRPRLPRVRGRTEPSDAPPRDRLVQPDAAPRQRLVDIDTVLGAGHPPRRVRAHRAARTAFGERLVHVDTERDLQLPHAVVHVPHRRRVLLHRRSRHRTGPLPRFVAQRGLRFLVPFVVMGLVIYFGKVTVSRFIEVENDRRGWRQGLTSLLWSTPSSPALALWYIFVVFVFCLVIPPMMWLSIRFCRARLMPLVVASALLYILPVPGYVYLDRVAHFMIFRPRGRLDPPLAASLRGEPVHRAGAAVRPLRRADRSVAAAARRRVPGTVVAACAVSRDSLTSLMICGSDLTAGGPRPLPGAPAPRQPPAALRRRVFARHLPLQQHHDRGGQGRAVQGHRFERSSLPHLRAGVVSDRVVGPIVLKRGVLSRNAFLHRMTT